MPAKTTQLPMRRGEFIALIAMMFATIAFSIDAMLPALHQIGEELVPEDPTRAALVLTSFVFGMGLGTFFCGPLSDAYGRRRVMFCGASLYIVSAAAAWASNSFELILAARVLQGIGAAGPRVVSVAVIRDLFSGREMARILSIVMIIFTLVPAIAPAMGVLIIHAAGWRAIFASFIIFSLISVLWLWLRLPETLPVAARRPIRLALMRSAVQQMFKHRTVCLAILVQTSAMAALFSLLMLIQPVYAHTFDRLDTFPYWFGVIALASGFSSLMNAVLVMHFGMRRLVTVALGVQIVFSAIMLSVSPYTGIYSFPLFLIWQFFVFFQAGLTVGNLNAIAMEPMGHIAGMAASVVGAFSTVIAAAIASPIALLFDGTIRPLVGTILVLATLGFILMLIMAIEEKRELANA